MWSCPGCYTNGLLPVSQRCWRGGRTQFFSGLVLISIVSTVYFDKVGGMLRQIDTKDDLEVLNWCCRYFLSTCYSRHHPCNTSFLTLRYPQVMAGYLRWLNAAPEPDDEVSLIKINRDAIKNCVADFFSYGGIPPALNGKSSCPNTLSGNGEYPPP